MKNVVIQKNWPVKGLYGRYSWELIDWRQFLVYIQSCWYFQSSFGICTLMCCPSLFLSGSTLLPPPLFPVWISILLRRLQCVRTGASEGTFSWGLKKESEATSVPGSGASENPFSWGLKKESDVTCVPGSPTRERGFLALYSPSMWW